MTGTSTASRSRQPKGVSTGGQFATEHRSEATGVTLSPNSADSQAVARSFCAAGGFTEGEFFALSQVTRSAEGVWTVEFTDSDSACTGDAYTATWSTERGYTQDETARGDYYGTHIEPRRDDPAAFAKDLLGVDGGREGAFFARAEAQYQEHSGALVSVEDLVAMHQASGLVLGERDGDGEGTISEVWRNQDGSWTVEICAGGDGSDGEELVSASYVVDREEGLLSTTVIGPTGTEAVHARQDPFQGSLIRETMGLEPSQLSSWADQAESRYASRTHSR